MDSPNKGPVMQTALRWRAAIRVCGGILLHDFFLVLLPTDPHKHEVISWNMYAVWLCLFWCGYKKHLSGVMWPIPIFFTRGYGMRCVSAIVASWYENDLWITGPLWGNSGSHRSHHKGPLMRNFMFSYSFPCCWTSWLAKQSSRWWFGTPWLQFGSIAILMQGWFQVCSQPMKDDVTL